ncbi:MbeD/MobD family mobilization/exclusion protein, partial [Enterobacter hormaechei]
MQTEAIAYDGTTWIRLKQEKMNMTELEKELLCALEHVQQLFSQRVD